MLVKVGGGGDRPTGARGHEGAVLGTHLLAGLVEVRVPEEPWRAALHFLQGELGNFVVESASPHRPHDVDHRLRLGIHPIPILSHFERTQRVHPVGAA